MFELKNQYICDYWFNDNIIDCSKSIDDSSEKIPVIIFNNENNVITQKYVEHLFEASGTLKNSNIIEPNKEKLNYNYKINNTQIDNEYRKRKNKPNPGSNISDISIQNTEYYNQFKPSRQNISNNRVFDVEKTNKHKKLFNQSCTNNYTSKRHLYVLSKTSRLYEFQTGKRKVLLDSQSKSKFLKDN